MKIGISLFKGIWSDCGLEDFFIFFGFGIFLLFVFLIRFLDLFICEEIIAKCFFLDICSRLL